MPSTSKRSHRSRAQWQALIARAEHSDLSVTAFCRRESVSTASFYTWRNRLRPITTPVPAPAAVDSGFIDLGTLEQAKDRAGPWEVELDLGAGMVLRLRRG
jgi:transposase-like protein